MKYTFNFSKNTDLIGRKTSLDTNKYYTRMLWS